jgi:hypothetical protein
MCFKEQGVDWNDMAQKRIQWEALVHTGMNIQVTQNKENFLTT